mgnify:CR=1 FL=1
MPKLLSDNWKPTPKYHGSIPTLDLAGVPLFHVLKVPLLCVDVDPAAPSPVTLSSPLRFENRERTQVGDEWAFPDEIYWGDPEPPKLTADFVPFFIGMVLPRLPPGAKGAFVVVGGTLTPVLAEQVHGGLAQRFYENGTPFVLHAAAEYTPWIGGMPEYDTLKRTSAGRISEAIDATVSYTHLTLPTTPYV